MDTDQISRNNHSFYYGCVGLEMCEGLFIEAVLQSFDEPALYSIENENYAGYVNIDSTDIKNRCTHGSFMDAIRNGIISRVGMKIPRSITGDLNTEVEIIEGIYKFAFHISKYERDAAHRFEEITDPSSLPDDEQLGRFVDLKITIAEQHR